MPSKGYLFGQRSCHCEGCDCALLLSYLLPIYLFDDPDWLWGDPGGAFEGFYKQPCCQAIAITFRYYKFYEGSPAWGPYVTVYIPIGAAAYWDVEDPEPQFVDEGREYEPFNSWIITEMTCEENGDITYELEWVIGEGLTTLRFTVPLNGSCCATDGEVSYERGGYDDPFEELAGFSFMEISSVEVVTGQRIIYREGGDQYYLCAENPSP
jgi:hypothetical protein